MADKTQLRLIPICLYHYAEQHRLHGRRPHLHPNRRWKPSQGKILSTISLCYPLTQAQVDGPSIGSAVVLQGGRVKHLASRAFGSAERITTITSFRLSTTGIWDESYLSNVRSYDHLPGLYKEWSLYRLKKMREEIEVMENRLSSEQVFQEQSVTTLCSRIADYATRTVRQMTSPSIREEVVARFGQASVAGAITSWRKVRHHADVQRRVTAASDKTVVEVPEMKPYLLDWQQTRARMALGIPETSPDGPFHWDAEDEYYFPDELARQGLNELLIWWLARFEVAVLA